MIEKSISDYLTNDDIDLNSRDQNGLVKFEFLTKVTAFNIRDEILNGSIDKKHQLMKINKVMPWYWQAPNITDSDTMLD